MENFRSFLFVFISITVSFICLSEERARAVVGGSPVAPDSLVARQTVLFSTHAAQGHAGCTATILDESHALTAAHCLAGVDTRERPGEALLFFSTQYSPTASTRVVTATQGFSSDPRLHQDIAVLTFSGGIPEGYFPVILTANPRIPLGSDVLQAGYGSIAYQNTMSRGVLRSVATKLLALDSGARTLDAGANGKSICNGDSGGPDFILVQGRLEQIGVHVTGDCENRSRSTDVRYYLKWIDSTGARPRVH